MNKFNILFAFIFLFAAIAKAQENISLQKAIEIALKNNYDIRIAHNEQEMLINNVSAGSAGMLPRVDANLSQSNSLTDSKQKFSTGAESDKNHAAAHSLNAYVALNWTVFDGFKMFATYQKLKEIEAAGESTLRMQMEQTIEQVISAYFNIVKQKALLVTLDSSMTISEIKERIARAKFQTGIYSKVEWLQAKVDLNSDKSNYKRQLLVMEQAKVNLNTLLAQDVSTAIDAADSIMTVQNSDYNQLQQKLTAANAELVRAAKAVKINGLSIREYQALRYPVIGLNGNYTLAHSTSQSGLILESRSKGINYGFTASYNLFNGFTTSRAIKNAKLNYDVSKMEYDQLKNSIEGDLLIAWKNLSSLIEITQMEKQNSDLAHETVILALERYRTGTISEIQMKDIQQSYLQTMTNYISSLYDAKIAETALKRISGELMK